MRFERTKNTNILNEDLIKSDDMFPGKLPTITIDYGEMFAL